MYAVHGFAEAIAIANGTARVTDRRQVVRYDRDGLVWTVREQTLTEACSKVRDRLTKARHRAQQRVTGSSTQSLDRVDVSLHRGEEPVVGSFELRVSHEHIVELFRAHERLDQVEGDLRSIGMRCRADGRP